MLKISKIKIGILFLLISILFYICYLMFCFYQEDKKKFLESSIFNFSFVYKVIEFEKIESEKRLLEYGNVNLSVLTKEELINYLSLLQMNRDSILLKEVSDYYLNKGRKQDQFFDNLMYGTENLEKNEKNIILEQINKKESDGFLSKEEKEMLSFGYVYSKENLSFDKENIINQSLQYINEDIKNNEKIMYIKKLILLKFGSTFDELYKKEKIYTIDEYIKKDFEKIKKGYSIQQNIKISLYQENIKEKMKFINKKINETKTYITKLFKKIEENKN